MKASLVLCAALIVGSRSGAPNDDHAADLAVSIEADLGVPARVEISHGRFTALRIGATDGPSVAVVLGVDDECLDTMRTIAVEFAQRARLDDRSILVLAGGPESDLSSEAITDPARNFPGDWPAARDAHGVAAGPYPASDPWVRGVVDTLIAEQDCAAVIDARDRPGHAPGAGSLGLYVESCLHLPYVATAPTAPEAQSKDRSLLELIQNQLVSVPILSLDDARWKRVAAGTWALDVRLSNEGVLATGHRGDPSSRRTSGCRLGVEVRDGAYSWSACAVAPLGPGTLRLVDIVRGSEAGPETVRLPDLGGGETHRLRLLFTVSGDATLGVPEVALVAEGARAVRTSRRTFLPAK